MSFILFAPSVRRAVIAAFLLLTLRTADAATAEVVDVTVRVDGASSSPVRDAYVALVHEWQPSRRPAAEQIAERGIARFRVPPGNYFVIGGAPGHSVASRGPLKLSGSEMNLTITVSPLRLATGTLRGPDDVPVSGARVSTLNAAVLQPLGKLSELATRHLVADFSATTDSAGTWTLGLPKGAVPLFFEAEGWAPAWRIVAEGDSGTIDSKLSQGAQLTITTDRQDNDLVVTLSKEGSDASPEVPAARQPLLWARSAKQKVLEWDSLSPGTYAIHARYPAASYFMPTAIRIGTAVLTAGEQQQVQVALLAARAPVTTTIAMLVPDISPSDLGTQLQAFGRSTRGGPMPLEHVVEEVMGGSLLHVRLNDESRPPFFAITEERFIWTNPAAQQHDPNATPPTASVHWRADVDAQFRSLEKELPLPRTGLARVRDCKDRDEVTVPFDIGASGFARFTVAAECRSLILELEPFEPVVLSRVLRRGEQSLGELVLRAAATADVRVTRDPGGEIISGATVEIVTRDSERTSRPVVVARALTNEAGWAHFATLPPYRELRATAKNTDGNRSDAAALRLSPREVGLIDPLRIGAPAALIVDAQIDEGFLARFPSARVTEIFLTPIDPFRESESLQQNVSGEEVRFAPLAEGEWQVRALVIITKTSYAPFDLGAIALKAGETRRLEARVQPNVFEGIVTAQGQPVVAKVMLDDVDQTLGSQTDASGLFQIVLERPGIYPVTVARLSAQGNSIPIGNVPFTDSSRRIEIRIPDSATAIVKVRAGDRPVKARTLVMMSRRNDGGLEDRMTKRGRLTTPAGEVTFEDLAPGVWTFSVEESETGRRAEKSVAIEAGEDQTVELVLAEGHAIEGTIRSLGATSLPRAAVECLFIGRGGVGRAGTISDAEGHFAIRLVAPPPSSALCSVIGPNGSVDAFRATPEDRINFTMPGATGTLRILHSGQRPNWDKYWLVSFDGRPVKLSAGALIFARSPSTMVIPALAAGRWKLVTVETLQQLLALASGLGASLPAEAEFTLGAGTTETVQIGEVPAP